MNEHTIAIREMVKEFRMNLIGKVLNWNTDYDLDPEGLTEEDFKPYHLEEQSSEVKRLISHLMANSAKVVEYLSNWDYSEDMVWWWIAREYAKQLKADKVTVEVRYANCCCIENINFYMDTFPLSWVEAYKHLTSPELEKTFRKETQSYIKVYGGYDQIDSITFHIPGESPISITFHSKEIDDPKNYKPDVEVVKYRFRQGIEKGNMVGEWTYTLGRKGMMDFLLTIDPRKAQDYLDNYNPFKPIVQLSGLQTTMNGTIKKILEHPEQLHPNAQKYIHEDSFGVHGGKRISPVTFDEIIRGWVSALAAELLLHLKDKYPAHQFGLNHLIFESTDRTAVDKSVLYYHSHLILQRANFEVLVIDIIVEYIAHTAEQKVEIVDFNAQVLIPN